MADTTVSAQAPNGEQVLVHEIVRNGKRTSCFAYKRSKRVYGTVRWAWSSSEGRGHWHFVPKGTNAHLLAAAAA